MNELLHVIKREYLTRVRTKSFILMTLLVPLLLSFVMLLSIYFAAQQKEDNKQLKIGLIDPTNSLNIAIEDSTLTIEHLTNQTTEDIRNLILTDKWNQILSVTKFDSTGINILYYSSKQPDVFMLNQIKTAIQKVVVNEKLATLGIENVEELIRSIKNSVVIESIKVSNEKAETFNNPYQLPLCMALGLIIYLFIILFASQVMRGVMEEKTNRIVELIITSISAEKFMAGKIIGIALLGLTQIVCWIVIMYGVSMLLSGFLGTAYADTLVNQRINPDSVNQILNNLNLIDFNIIIPTFIFFFITGYLLYSSIFAAIAAAANHSDDMQQVTMIVTAPLILSLIVLANTAIAPDSSLSYWFSIIPLTSPVVMMGRIVYGAPIQDILLSMCFLVATVIGTIILSGKVYKTTILYTGKKITFKEIISWIRNPKQ